MKATILSLTALAALATAALESFAADELPKPQAFARYEKMMERSPFAVATAPAAAPAPTPNFAKDLYIANAARTPGGDLVTIASTTDKSFKKYLSTNTTVDGYSVPSIEWSDRVGATQVTISKDGQFATLTFNQALLSQPVASAQAMPMQGVPPQPPIQNQLQMQQQMNAQSEAVPAQSFPAQQVPNAVKQQGIPALPTPPPRVRGMIPRNPAGAPVATPAQPLGQAPVSDE